MSPLQPRHDRPADRDDRARRQTQDHAEAPISLHADEHYDALVHIARCLSCRSELFVEFLAAMDQVEAQITVES